MNGSVDGFSTPASALRSPADTSSSRLAGSAVSGGPAVRVSRAACAAAGFGAAGAA